MKNIKHEFVKIFGGTYYDNKNHEIANWYSYAGAIPLWIKGILFKMGMNFKILWCNICILYYRVIIKINHEK